MTGEAAEAAPPWGVGRRLRWFVIALAFAACAANLTVPLWTSADVAAPFDLHYFVRAGQLWLADGTPYGPAYHEVVPGQHTPEGWFVYPPAIRPFCEWIAATPTGARRACVALAALAAWAVAAAATAAQLPGRLPFLSRVAAVAVLFAFVALGTRLATDGGQTTPLLAAGLAGVLWGAGWGGRGADAALSAGLVFLLLKPQLGVPVLLVFLVRRERLGAVAAALAITAALSLHGSGGRPDLVVVPYLHGITAYGSFPVNGPELSAGPGTLLAPFGLPGPPTWAVGAILLSMTGAFAATARSGGSAVAMAVLAALALMPTHAYDHVLLAALVAFVVPLAPYRRLAAGAAGLLVLQSAVLAQLVLPAAASAGLAMPSFLHLAALIDAGALLALLAAVTTVQFGRAASGGGAGGRRPANRNTLLTAPG